MLKTITASILLFVFASAASGAKFQNGGFEHGSVSNTCNVFDLPAGSTVITGWTVSQGTIDWEGPPPCGWKSFGGKHSIDLVGQIGFGGIQQTFDTVAGATYGLTFRLAGNPGGLPAIKPLAVTINGVTTNFTFDTTGKSALNMGWVTRTIDFVAAGTSSTVEFASDIRPFGGINAGAAIDKVRLERLL